MTARRSSDSPSPPPSIDAPSLPLDHPLVALGSPSLPAFIPESLAVGDVPNNTERPAELSTELLTDHPTDPPPPYPSPRTRRRARGTRRRVSEIAQSRTTPLSPTPQQQQQQQQQSQHYHVPSTESDTETQTPRSPRTSLPPSSSVYDGADVSETTPLLGGGGGGGGGANNSPNANAVRTFLRPRSLSQSSMNSFAPSLASLAQTAWVFFSECESDEEEDSRFENGHNHNGQPSFEGEGEFETEDAGPSRTIINSTRRRAARYPHPATFIRASASEFGIDLENQNQNHNPRPSAARQRPGLFSAQAWARYFRPVTKAIYWRSLTHLVAVNFPFALAAWVYLFVFTVTGTTLLILLPLGAILCFFNLLGARAFSRAELFLQTKFHSPLHYPLTVLHAAAAAASSSSSYPSTSTSTSSPASSVHQLIAAYPIFTRTRPPSASELESGEAVVGEEVREGSFYRNTYAMFTDSTSFQALFYFLVIKPAITLLFTVFFLVVCVPLMVLVVPAPAVLRVCRRIGRWQAVVAVEGLAVGVR